MDDAQKEMEQRIQENRIAKATALALMLRRAGATRESAGTLDRKARRLTASLAGVHEPSELTWALVLAMLAVAEAPVYPTQARRGDAQTEGEAALDQANVAGGGAQAPEPRSQTREEGRQGAPRQSHQTRQED